MKHGYHLINVAKADIVSFKETLLFGISSVKTIILGHFYRGSS